VDIHEVLHLVLLVGLDGLVTWLPVGGAYFSVFVSELETLDKSNSLINASSDGIVINLNTSDFAFSVDNEKASESGSVHWVLGALNEDSIVSRNVFADVGQEWVVDVAQTTFSSGSFEPSQVSEVGVSGHTDDLGT
jgi:hypothetical protein